MKTLLKEPLLHFLLLGAVLFYLYAITANSESGDDKIAISQANITQLQYSFEKTRQRKPSEQELDALIKNFLKEQVAYQKGVEMGLLDGDTIIQKRIQQKVEFIVEDLASGYEPSDEELTAFLNAHRDDYRSERVFSFMQLYFDPTKHDDLNTRLDNTLMKINSLASTEQTSENLLALSDNIYLDYQYSDISYGLVARYFGSEFADSLMKMPMDSWQSEVKSGYGLHLVSLTARRGGQVQSLAEVRTQVKKDWLNQQRQISLDNFYQALFVEYQVDSQIDLSAG
ncbi:MAG: peptidylprolyl isomerase [Colwellia sp.]